MDGSITKNDMRRAINYQIVKTSLNNYLIDIIFADKESILLEHFCLAIWCYRIFQRHAKTDKYHLTSDEFLSIFEEQGMN